MPQDSPREADTVRLNSDGTLGRGRPSPPVTLSAGPGRSAVAEAPPVQLDAQPSPEAPAAESARRAGAGAVAVRPGGHPAGRRGPRG